MSYNCTKHNWQHLFNECPSCYQVTTTTDSVGHETRDIAIAELRIQNDRLKKQLNVAVETFEIAKNYPLNEDDDDYLVLIASRALKKIKSMEGVE
jgi:hypothetical protein